MSAAGSEPDSPYPLTAPNVGANVYVHGAQVVLLPSRLPLTLSPAAAEALAERLRAAAREAAAKEGTQ